MNAITPRRLGYSLVALEMLITLAISTVWLFTGIFAAMSALWGGLVAVFPNLYFAHRFFATTNASQVTRIIR